MPRTTLGREVTRGTICRDHWQVTVGLWCADVLPPGEPTPLLLNVAWRATDAGLPPRPGDARLTLTLRKKTDSALSDAHFDAPDGPREKPIPGDVSDGVLLMHATTTATRPGAPDLELVVKVDGKDLGVISFTVAAPATPPPLAIKADNGTDAPPPALGFTRPVRLRAVPAGAQLRWVSATPAATFGGDATQAAVDVTGHVPADGGPLPELRVWVLSADASGATMAATHVFQPAARIAVRLRRAGVAGDPPPFLLGWVYWRANGTTTALRTDNENALLLALKSGGDRAKPWDYTEAFDFPAGAAVQVAYSKGHKPLPDAVLTDRAAAFVPITLPQPGTPPPGQAPRVAIDLPDLTLNLAKPKELAFWPVMAELPDDDYAKEGITQGAGIFGAGGPAENGPAPALAANAAHRPRERGLKVEGTVEAAATAVRLRLLDANGAALRLRTGIEPNAAQADEIAATLAAPAGASRAFSAALFLADSAAAAGPVQLLALADGLPQARTDAWAVHLCRLELALVDDFEANRDGQHRGPVHGEGDERIEVDFLSSPQADAATLGGQARARRMVPYLIQSGVRALFPPASPPHVPNPDVMQPQMPLWMGELQLVGVSLDQLQELMVRAAYRQNAPVIVGPPAPVDLRLALDWALRLEWDGPDINSPGVVPAVAVRPHQTYSDVLALGGHAALRLRFRPDTGAPIHPTTGDDLALGADGQANPAFDPAPERIPWPVADRRLPQVVLRGQQRPWGRRAGAPLRDAVVIEFQPRVEIGGEEKIRGGNGTLSLTALTVDNEAVDGGRVRGAGGALADAAASPLLQLPAFRIRGTNPGPQALMDALVDALVQEFFDANSAQAHVAMLPLGVWQDTMRRVMQHESGGTHFETRDSGRYADESQLHRYGIENGMPKFGAPHGYGYGQLDGPLGRPATADEVWSFVANIRTCILELMDEKADRARAMMAPHLNNPVTRRERAVFRRETVRRYNGGSEFTWSGGDWMISPSLAKTHNVPNPHPPPATVAETNPRLRYCNVVLDTHVAYFTGDGSDAAHDYPWPLAFGVGDYGTGI